MLLLLNNERGDNKCLSIGELLKEKQQQGKEVYMQIFDFNIYQDIAVEGMKININIFTT